MHGKLLASVLYTLGEFGVVYKGYLLQDGGKVVTATVAVKTLKG